MTIPSTDATCRGGIWDRAGGLDGEPRGDPFDVGSGANCDITAPSGDFCFTPDNGHSPRRSEGRLSATSGLMRRSKQQLSGAILYQADTGVAALGRAKWSGRAFNLFNSHATPTMVVMPATLTRIWATMSPST